jgi:hypothetical protein
MTKLFCIGANKTGTTSLRAFFADHGYRCGDQAAGELLMGHYAAGHWQPIINLAATADFFQDLPFSARHTYRHLAKAYPDARFILTRRDSAETWYHSLVRFHARKFGDGVHPPTAAQLMAAEYRYPGFAWIAHKALYNTPIQDPYHRDTLLRWYYMHCEEVHAFFAPFPERLLDVAIEDPLAAQKIAIFADLKLQYPTLPHLNAW